MDISVVIIVKNGERAIKECLEALHKFNDVVVYDNGSEDNTIEICKSFDNVNLVEGEFLGFGPTKKLASTYAKHDWILSLDSDEIMTEEGVRVLEEKNLQPQTVYSIKR
ncbi:MAG TPA: glycosyltransferase, partial [Nitratifractor sp.]|nr:glycosyltransferase [Nitratifractor sp.]